MKNQDQPFHYDLPGDIQSRSISDGASTEPRVPSDTSNDPGGEACGWYSRGYLPHFDSCDVVQHVTFHLVDSLPKETVERLLSELKHVDADRQQIEKQRNLEILMDAGHGECWLQRPDCARIVQDALLHFDGERYRMIAWVIMPNHVHALFQTLNNWSLNSVVASWKTFTANRIRKRIDLPEQPQTSVWHPEFWDRYIRDKNHLVRVMDYVHNNPVKAGLVLCSEQWRWSSAFAGNAGLRTRSSGSASTEPRVPSVVPGKLRRVS